MKPWAVAVLSLCVFVGAVCVRYKIWPAIEVIVPLPMGDARVRVQGWAGLVEDGLEVLVVETPTGTLKSELGTDWGVGPRLRPSLI